MNDGAAAKQRSVKGPRVPASPGREGLARRRFRYAMTPGSFGGWPGAILAQQLLRHKTAKLSFRSVFWMSVLLNVFVFVAPNAPLGELLA